MKKCYCGCGKDVPKTNKFFATYECAINFADNVVEYINKYWCNSCKQWTVAYKDFNYVTYDHICDKCRKGY